MKYKFWLLFLILVAAPGWAASNLSGRKVGTLQLLNNVDSRHMKISQGGRYLAIPLITGRYSSTCVVFERPTHKSWRVPGDFRVDPLAFSPDGNALWVFVGGSDTKTPLPGIDPKLNGELLALYDLKSRRFRFAVNSNFKQPSDSTLSSNGKSLIVLSGDGVVHSFDTSNGRQQWQYKAHGSLPYPTLLTLSADGSRFVRLVDGADGKQHCEIVATRDARVLSTLTLPFKSHLSKSSYVARLAPRGTMFSVFSPDEESWSFLDARTGHVKWKMKLPYDWQWSPDARYIAARGLESRSLELRDAQSGRVVAHAPGEHDSSSMIFSPDSSLIYVLTGNDTGFHPNIAVWQWRLFPTPAQHQADALALRKTRADEERFALSSPNINQSLILAVRAGNLQRVAFLLDHGASIKTRHDSGSSLLEVAIASVPSPLPDINGVRTPQGNRVELVKLLLARGASIGNEGAALLSSAADRGDDKTIELLLNHGVSPNADHTALQKAITMGNMSSVHLLLDKGADPSAPDGYGITPLSALSDATANINSAQDEVTIMRLLLDRGAEINALASRGDFKATPLERAVINAKVLLVTLLLERGADPNIVDSLGDTSLIALVKADKKNNEEFYFNSKRSDAHLQIARALLAHGANLDATDKAGQRARDLAVSPALKALLEAAHP